MSSSNLRIIGYNISRMVVPAIAGSKAVSKLAPVAIMSTIRRELHNRPKTANQQMQVVGSSAMPVQEQFMPLAESVFKLDEVKVFQDEQIIQLAFKCGQTVNYTMSWLRNLCSCPSCVSNKFQHNPTMKSASLIDGQLSVARFSSTEDELVIEWLDCDSYKAHVSTYNLKYLNLYANSRNN